MDGTRGSTVCWHRRMCALFGYVASIIKVALNIMDMHLCIFARMSSFKRFASEIIVCLIHYQIGYLKLGCILSQIILYCISYSDSLRLFFFLSLILGVRGTFCWNHAASGKCHKCMRFLQSLIKRDVSSALGEGHINSYFSGISSEYREARFVCL